MAKWASDGTTSVSQIKDNLKQAVKAIDKKEKNRKIALFAAAAIIAVIAVFLVSAVFLADTCSNNSKDFAEEGVDCGGNCFKQCLSAGEQSSAAFQAPAEIVDVAVDSQDRIYIVDKERHRLMVYSPDLKFLRNVGEKDFSSGGKGDYQFDTPLAVAIGNEKVFVSDRFNSRIQVFDAKLNFLKSINETPNLIGRFTDLKLWNNSLVAAGEPHHTVYLIADNGAVEELGEGFSFPFGAAVSPDGRLFVADSGNHVIKIFDSGKKLVGTLGSGKGSADNQFNYPSGLAFDSSGRVFVADAENNRVQVFDKELKYYATIGGRKGQGNLEFNRPVKVAIDSKGRILVVDAGNNRLMVYGNDMKFIGSLNGIGLVQAQQMKFSPKYIAAGGDGKIFISEEIKQQVTVLDTEYNFAGEIGGKKGFGEKELDSPRDLTVDSQGRVFVADSANNRVQVFDERLEFIATIGGKRGSGRNEFNDPRSVAVDGTGRVFVVDKDNRRVQVFDAEFNYLATLKPNDMEKFKEPVPIAIGPGGKIYVADSKSSFVSVFSSSLEFEKSIDVGKDVVEMEGGIKVDGKGRLLIVDLETHRVKMVDAESGETVKAIGGFGAEPGKFNFPLGIAIAQNGNILVADYGNGRVQVFDPELNFLQEIGGGKDKIIETAE